MLSKGDYVQVLDENEEGIITQIQGDQVTIETKDGFVLNYQNLVIAS